MTPGAETLLVGVATCFISVVASIFAAGKKQGGDDTKIKRLEAEIDNMKGKCGDAQQAKCRKEFIESKIFELFQKSSEQASNDMRGTLEDIRKSIRSTEENITKMTQSVLEGEKKRDEARQRMFAAWGELQSDKASSNERIKHLTERVKKLESSKG